MKPGQYTIRVVVFCIVVLDPSGGGFGIALGVIVGVAIGITCAGINAFKRFWRREKHDESEED